MYGLFSFLGKAKAHCFDQVKEGHTVPYPGTTGKSNLASQERELLRRHKDMVHSFS